mgnify:CR=1 FL=1
MGKSHKLMVIVEVDIEECEEKDLPKARQKLKNLIEEINHRPSTIIPAKISHVSVTNITRMD